MDERPDSGVGREPQSDTSPSESDDGSEAFAREAESSDPGFLAEFVSFMRHNKKWWLVPIVMVLLLFGLLVILSGTGAAPFIYTLF